MSAVSYWQNRDGTWTGRIFGRTYTSDLQSVLMWLRANGESV